MVVPRKLSFFNFRPKSILYHSCPFLADNARPYLQTLHGESKDYTYINAVYMDGYTRKMEWIVTEWPKPPNIDSLWALIFDHSAHTLVCLTNQPNQKVSIPID